MIVCQGLNTFFSVSGISPNVTEGILRAVWTKKPRLLEEDAKQVIGSGEFCVVSGDTQVRHDLNNSLQARNRIESWLNRGGTSVVVFWHCR